MKRCGLTLETHCPSRSTRTGDQAPAARTTTSASHFVPSTVSTPTHFLPSGDKRRVLNVPFLPEAHLTPKDRHSRATESRASRAATHPPLEHHRPLQPYPVEFISANRSFTSQIGWQRGWRRAYLDVSVFEMRGLLLDLILIRQPLDIVPPKGFESLILLSKVIRLCARAASQVHLTVSETISARSSS